MRGMQELKGCNGYRIPRRKLVVEGERWSREEGFCYEDPNVGQKGLCTSEKFRIGVSG